METKSRAKYQMVEYWLIKPGKSDEWLNCYREHIRQVLRKIEGYGGWIVMAVEPGEKVYISDSVGYLPIGPPKSVWAQHPGILTNGVRTDVSLNQ